MTQISQAENFWSRPFCLSRLGGFFHKQSPEFLYSKCPLLRPIRCGAEGVGRWLEHFNSMRSFAALARPKWLSDLITNPSNTRINLYQNGSYSSAIFLFSFFSLLDSSSSAILIVLFQPICASQHSGYLYIGTVFTSYDAFLFSHESRIAGWTVHSGCSDVTEVFSPSLSLVVHLSKVDTKCRTIVVEQCEWCDGRWQLLFWNILLAKNVCDVHKLMSRPACFHDFQRERRNRHFFGDSDRYWYIRIRLFLFICLFRWWDRRSMRRNDCEGRCMPCDQPVLPKYDCPYVTICKRCS